MAETLENIIETEKREQAVLDRISYLANSVDGASSEEASRILSKIQNAQSTIPPSNRSLHFSEEVAAAKEKAEERKREEEAKAAEETAQMMAAVAGVATGGLMSASAAEMAFSQNMFQFMTAKEQQLFESLSGPQSLVMLDANGQVLRDATGGARIEIVGGSLLQADLALLKHHTFDKSDPARIENTPDESPEGKRLHEALLRLEGLHIHRQVEAGVPLEKAHEASREIFARAHEQVNSTVALEANARMLQANAQNLHLASATDPSLAGQAQALAANAKVLDLAAKFHADKLGEVLQVTLNTLSGSEPSQPREQQKLLAIDASTIHAPANTPIGIRRNAPENAI